MEATESFISLARAAIVAVLLIYILLVIQFKTLSQPLLIILAIPMALIGAIWGLVITGHEAGFMAFLGMISLIGTVECGHYRYSTSTCRAYALVTPQNGVVLLGSRALI